MKTLLFLSGLLLLITTGCSKKEDVKPVNQPEIVSVSDVVYYGGGGDPTKGKVYLDIGVIVTVNTPVDDVRLSGRVWKWDVSTLSGQSYSIDATKKIITFKMHINDGGYVATKKHPFTYDWLDKDGTTVEKITVIETDTEPFTDSH